MNLGIDFVSFFKSYKEYIEEQTAIVPYVNSKDNDCSIVQNEFKVSMDPIYPEFYTKCMINTKDISNSELERRFLEADWLTNDYFDELVMNVPTKDEMQPDNVHHSTIKCKSSFEEKCLRLFPIGRRFVTYRQLEQCIETFLRSWSIMKHRDGNSYKCFYSEGGKKKIHNMFTTDSDPNKQSVKSLIKCPFVVRFSILGIKKDQSCDISYR